MTTSVDTILEITKRNLKAYGQEVVEQRAVPDYRDGLKPVHRFILWSCYSLGLKHGTPFKYAARTVGDVIGKYSPHGDQSTYGAMVGMTGVKSDDGKVWTSRNSCVPLIEGYGNWGDNLDSAAAMRYTESRLSEFSTKYLLDPVYLAVSDYVDNFSGDEKVPLVLPSKLPVLLLNGSVSIAFGVSAECPSFAASGIVKLVKLCLSGTTITAKHCTDSLQFAPVFGGVCTSDKKAVYEFHKHGTGSLTFRPEIAVDEKKRTVTIVSSCPGLSSRTSWDTLVERLSQLREVKYVSDATDRHGFKFEVVADRGVAFDTFVPMIEDLLVRKYSYSIGVTRRELDSVTFKRTSAAEIIKDWCAWRIELEAKVIKYLIGLENKKLQRFKLLLLAVDSLKIIVASLSKEDSAAHLVQHLKITLEDANTILDMKVRQLKTLERKKILTNISETTAEIKSLTTSLKNPTTRVLKELDSISV